MIITKTPFRVSFVGGGSDLADFYLEHGGEVISTSIDKYMYVSSHRYFDGNGISLKYSKTETVSTVEDIEHPIFKEVLKEFNLKGLEISSHADIPAGSGLGSSSSFTVNLLMNCFVRKNHYVTKETLATLACEMEIERLKEPIGKQDQYAASYGGLNHIRFLSSGHVEVNPLYLDKRVLSEFKDWIYLGYLGEQREANSILVDQKKEMKSGKKVDALKAMVSLVPKFKEGLYSANFPLLGELLNENWTLKKSLSTKISSHAIDDIYEDALKAGAIGGKLLGAGGCGFMLFICDPDKHSRLKEALSTRVKEFTFGFDHQGASLIYLGDENELN